MEIILLGDEKPAKNADDEGYQGTDIYRPLNGDRYRDFAEYFCQPVEHATKIPIFMN